MIMDLNRLYTTVLLPLAISTIHETGEYVSVCISAVLISVFDDESPRLMTREMRSR